MLLPIENEFCGVFCGVFMGNKKGELISAPLVTAGKSSLYFCGAYSYAYGQLLRA